MSAASSCRLNRWSAQFGLKAGCLTSLLRGFVRVNHSIPAAARWSLGLAVAVFVLVVPIVYLRWKYTASKRLRAVTPGRCYRSGQLTAGGFERAIRRYHIHTVINL